MIKSITLTLILFAFLLTLTGCETFRKKFVRKREKERKINVVVHTEEYKSKLSVDGKYKKYLLFWQVAHGELMEVINAQHGNRKKRISMAKKIIENLEQMRRLLLPQKQKELDAFIIEQRDIVPELGRYRLTSAQRLRIKSILEKQERQIKKDFSYKNVRQYLIK